MIVFVVVGPPVGAFAMTGIIGFVAFMVTIPVAYISGSLPAAVTGLGFGLLWVAGLPTRTRYLATAGLGGVASFVSTTVLQAFDLGSALLTGVAGIVAALVSSFVATRLIRSVERARLTSTAPPRAG